MTVSPTAICPTLSARVCWHTPWPLIRPHCVLRPRQPTRAPGSVTKPSTKPEVNTHGHHVRGQSMFDLVLVTSRPRQASFTASTIVQWPVDLPLAPRLDLSPSPPPNPRLTHTAIMSEGSPCLTSSWSLVDPARPPSPPQRSSNGLSTCLSRRLPPRSPDVETVLRLEPTGVPTRNVWSALYSCPTAAASPQGSGKPA